MKRKVVVIGGGIKGCAIAALLTATEEFDVTLVSRDKIGYGATSSNHGRLHLGTSDWRKGDTALMKRRLVGSELMRGLSHVKECEEESFYCFEKRQDADEFEKTCRKAKIPFRFVEAYSSIENHWINVQDFDAIASVPEFSFSPANVAGRLARFCATRGSQLRIGIPVTRVEDHSSPLTVELADGTRFEADLVINATSRWSNTIEPVLPTFEISWRQWRILCVRADVVPPLNQVVVVMDHGRKKPSVIPHHDWITIDHDVKELEDITSPEGLSKSGWRPIDLENRMDSETYKYARQYFRPLRDMPQDAWCKNVFSFAGVQGREKDAEPGSRSALKPHPEVPGYFVTFGGQASTALLDAVEIVEEFGNVGFCDKVERQELIEKLASLLPLEPHPESVPMIWEQMWT